MAKDAKDGASDIKFEHLGIGTVLNRNRLTVPPNQREYSWLDEHVEALFRDLQNAIATNKSTYFLGTIVLTGNGRDVSEISDGQQRLATTTILLATIRDYLFEQKEERVLQSIENEFLFKIVRETRAVTPRLTLNIDDRDFFKQYVILRPDDADRKAAAPRRLSHHRIVGAANKAIERVHLIVSAESERNRVDRLNAWVSFVEHNAKVIALRVPDDLNAFVMFETLNDRGLKTSQADLVKNYLFGEVGAGGIQEAHPKWAHMTGALEAIDDDEITVAYLRHLIITLKGPTERTEVFERIQKESGGADSAQQFLAMLANAANDYAAILTPEHKKWNAYHADIRRSVSTMLMLQVVQIRPLMLAVARSFDKTEAIRAFKQFVAWTVRFLIAGGGRGSALERAYSEAAQKVTAGTITTAAQLLESLRSIIPNDVVFEYEFANARVSKNFLARYYLRSLELTLKGMPEPEFVPNEDTVINLEHVLPENPAPNWPKIEPEIAEAHNRRIGNMVLLRASTNSTIGNDSFATKKVVYAQSGYGLTKEVGQSPDWGKAEIESRQKRLAGLAVKTWPLGSA